VARLDEARPAVARLRAMGFSTRDFDALCKAKGV